MRIWDLDPNLLCRQHLLAEHAELHGLWNVLTRGLKGYSRHPETLRWKGRLAALYIRHGYLVDELLTRGYHHHSKLHAIGKDLGEIEAPAPIISEQEQKIKLVKKCSECRKRIPIQLDLLF